MLSLSAKWRHEDPNNFSKNAVIGAFECAPELGGRRRERGERRWGAGKTGFA